MIKGIGNPKGINTVTWHKVQTRRVPLRTTKIEKSKMHHSSPVCPCGAACQKACHNHKSIDSFTTCFLTAFVCLVTFVNYIHLSNIYSTTQSQISRYLIKIVIQRYSYFNGLHWSCQYGFASSRNFPWHGIHKKCKGCSSVKRQIKDYTISFFLLQTLYWNRPSSFPFEIDTSKETNAACAAPCCPFIHFYH